MLEATEVNFLIALEAKSPKFKVSAGLLSPEASFLGLQMAAFLAVSSRGLSVVGSSLVSLFV